jgi:IclR family pca regulon transcriptional regulator
LAQIRARGFAVSNQVFVFGIRSVAAPIRNAAGETIAAVNVSAPAEAFNPATLEGAIVPAVRETAAELSQAYGWRADTSPVGAPA